VAIGGEVREVEREPVHRAQLEGHLLGGGDVVGRRQPPRKTSLIHEQELVGSPPIAAPLPEDDAAVPHLAALEVERAASGQVARGEGLGERARADLDGTGRPRRPPQGGAPRRQRAAGAQRHEVPVDDEHDLEVGLVLLVAEPGVEHAAAAVSLAQGEVGHEPGVGIDEAQERRVVLDDHEVVPPPREAGRRADPGRSVHRGVGAAAVAQGPPGHDHGAGG
jgi:hypothetical protein